MVVLDLLNPDEECDNTVVVKEEKQPERTYDRTRQVRVQIININGEVVDTFI